MAPNILLVVLDAVRRDAVEPYGAPRGATPAIADLAARGEALGGAYATASWTLPSHASMFTGLLPRQLGLAQAPGGTPQSAKPRLERFAERYLPNALSRAGYVCRGWSANLWASQHAGFDLGFDAFEYVPGKRADRLLGDGLGAQLAWALEGLRSRLDDGTAEIGRALREQIAAWSGRPSFWFVNLCECHSPYLPPRPWSDLSASERVRAALEARRHSSFQAMCMFAAGRWQIEAEAFARMRYLYARAAAYMDSWLADVLDALDRRGILDDTLVIVTSDHGENFGEGGLIGHGFSVDQRLIHVPLVIAGPGDTEIGTPFSLAELPRVIAQAAELDPHPWLERELPAGVAVAQYDPMLPSTHPRMREVAELWQLDEPGIERLTSTFTCATDGRMKLVVRDGAELLYDLANDPGEADPIDPAAANGTCAALRAALHHPSVNASGASAPDGAAPTVASDQELAALERQMKLLGYM